MKILTIIGARPQFIKAAMVSKAILHMAEQGTDISETILHTGQHYDYRMSGIFFQQLGIPEPKWNLGCTGTPEEMQVRIEEAIRGEEFDYVLVYGDTNSTLGGALAAQALSIPIIHVEAGLRSYNLQMAEERNRIATDKLSTWLFCPTETAVSNLEKEGIRDGVCMVGDVMYDAALTFAEIAEQQSTILTDKGLTDYYLATIHRAETTDHIENLRAILSAFAGIEQTIVLPLHPRTKKVIDADDELMRMVRNLRNLRIIDPVSYIDMVMLEKHASLILTDSGGVQKEAYFHGVPCVTMRTETEWVETVEAGWNTLTGYDTQRIIAATKHAHTGSPITSYGTGHAAENILQTIIG